MKNKIEKIVIKYRFRDISGMLHDDQAFIIINKFIFKHQIEYELRQMLEPDNELLAFRVEGFLDWQSAGK